MAVSRRSLLALSAAGSAAAALPTSAAARSQPSGERLGELRAGDRWLRAERDAAGVISLSAGVGDQRVASLREAVGVRWYRDDGNLPTSEKTGAWTALDRADGGWSLAARVVDPAGGHWETTTVVRADDDGFRLDTTFIRRGARRAASVRVHADFDASPAEAFNLAPGAIYNGNRADVVVPRRYCPMLTHHEVKTRETGEARRVIADLPRQDASTWWTCHLWGYQAASASISAWDPRTRAGVHLGYARTDGGRVQGVIYTADAQTGLHRVSVENPCVRERRFRSARWEVSPDVPHVFEDGDRAVIVLRLSPASAPHVPAFVADWTRERERRRSGRAPGQTRTPPRPADVVPRSPACELAVAFIDRELWVEDKGYYRTVKNNDHDPRELINGWGSGTMTHVPMFRLGSDQVKARVRRMTTFLLDNAVAPGGLFYGVLRKDGSWISADGDLDTSWWDMNALTPRRTTDMVFYAFDLSDAFRAEAGAADPLAARLDAASLKACEALARVWTREGEIPFLLNPHTEQAVWRGGHGGARAIGCLVRAAGRFGRTDLLAVAEQIADAYARTGLARGETWGGPSDVMQGTTDQESLTALTEGLVLLHEATGKARHLEHAIQGADLLSTWALDEEIVFPPDTVLGGHGINPFGALNASTQNCWGTPGFCVNSGLFLLKLYEQTNLTRMLDLLSDVVRLPMTMVVMPGQDWGSLEPGQMTECASFNDVPDDFGHAYLRAAHWPVNAMLQTELDLPSVYVDGDRLWRFDHIAASIERGGVRVTNGTAYAAKARVRWRGRPDQRVELAPGQSRLLRTPPLPR